MSINGMLSMGKDALLMNQYALSVVSDNISNMNTEGYSRQRVEQETIKCNVALKSGANIRMTTMGAQIAKITRFSDAYLDNQLRDATTESAFYNELQEGASTIENLLNELDGSSGLTSAFSEFYSALNDLASNPSDLATRAVVVQKAENITVKFNDYAKTLTNEKTNAVGSATNPDTVLNSSAASQVSQINDLLATLADINLNTLNLTTSTGVPSSILDERTMLVEELAQYIPIEYSENAVNGTCEISYKGQKLVSGSEVVGTFEVEATAVEDEPIRIVIEDKEGRKEDVTSTITSGSLGATLQLGQGIGEDVLSYQNVLSQLNTLASEFAKAYNDIQTYVDQANGKAALSITLDSEGNKILKAPTVDGAGNLISSNDPIFEASDGAATITAANISVNSNIASNAYGIATAIGDVDTTTGAVENPLAVGDTQALLDMLAERNIPKENLNGNTFDGFMTQLTTNLGVQVSTVNTFQESKSSVLEQLAETKSSLTGVNLDEELIDLVKYQRAYEASARIFNVASEVLETMVNLAR